MALEAVNRAVRAYEEARAAILAGKSWDAMTTLTRVGDRLAIAAEAAGGSCRGPRSERSGSRKARATPKKGASARKRKVPSKVPKRASEDTDQLLLTAFTSAIETAMATHPKT